MSSHRKKLNQSQKVAFWSAALGATLGLLASCAPQGVPFANGRFKPEQWIRFSQDASTLDRDSSGVWAGTGGLIYRAQLESITEARNFSFRTLLRDEGSSIRLVAFCAAQLAGGISFKATRIGNELQVQLIAAPTDKEPFYRTVFTSRFPARFDQSLSLSVDVHNGESPAHVLVWLSNDANARQMDLLFDSKSLPNEAWTQRGQSTAFGFELKNAELLEGQVNRAIATD